MNREDVKEVICLMDGFSNLITEKSFGLNNSCIACSSFYIGCLQAMKETNKEIYNNMLGKLFDALKELEPELTNLGAENG